MQMSHIQETGQIERLNSRAMQSLKSSDLVLLTLSILLSVLFTPSWKPRFHVVPAIIADIGTGALVSSLVIMPLRVLNSRSRLSFFEIAWFATPIVLALLVGLAHLGKQQGVGLLVAYLLAFCLVGLIFAVCFKCMRRLISRQKIALHDVLAAMCVLWFSVCVIVEFVLYPPAL
jgi:lysylphosphatidylglycerol synthetase-like protein (DUF2156 family)